MSIEELPSIPPPAIEPIAPLKEPVVAPMVPPVASSEPALAEVNNQEPVEAKKIEFSDSC